MELILFAVAIIALLGVGGYLGYKYGRKVEIKAQAVANAAKQAVQVVKS